MSRHSGILWRELSRSTASTVIPNLAAHATAGAKAANPAKAGRRGRFPDFLGQYFYFSMSLLIAAVVVYGFSHTIDQNLLHPHPPRPLLLYFHAAVFSSWLVFFILQSALIRTHNVRVHRTIGWFGVALGVAIILLGAGIAVTMARFNFVVLHHTDGESFMLVPLWDITCFTVTFALAILWRKKPEFHRRLILVASCALTAAGWGRFPPNLVPSIAFYAGVDLLVLLGVARDLIVTRRVHQVYRYALPLFIAGQPLVMYTVTHNPPLWLKIAHAIAG